MARDLFGPVSDAYAEFRPHYPESLYDALMDCVPSQTRAWDVGCGTGQASLSLAHRFLEVRATNASARQVERGTRHDRITYALASAHAFHAEAMRVLTRHGIIAEWSYRLLDVPSCKPIADAVNALDARLHDWWPAERAHVDNGYRDLAFPFSPIDLGPQLMHADWSREQLLGYLGTWSAVTRHQSEHAGDDPRRDVIAVIDSHWGAVERRQITWPLTVRVGTVTPPAG